LFVPDDVFGEALVDVKRLLSRDRMHSDEWVLSKTISPPCNTHV
jgi:hypothetical protein